jgi:hypothetical protein
MRGSLPTTNWSFARPFRSVAIIATAAGAILGIEFVHGDTPVDPAAVARPAEPAPCDADAPHSPAADVAAGWLWRIVPCANRVAGAVCEACATCPPGVWCAPLRTRGTGPHGPGGGPDD